MPRKPKDLGIKKIKTVTPHDNGSIHLLFEDNTEAQAFWESFGPGHGGEYNEENTETCNSGLTPEQIVELAYANS